MQNGVRHENWHFKMPLVSNGIFAAHQVLGNNWARSTFMPFCFFAFAILLIGVKPIYRRQVLRLDLSYLWLSLVREGA